MEFNQDNRSFRAPLTVLDTVAEQLADTDITLPDYCPDIEKILKCTLTPKIQTKSLSGGQLQVDGYCVINVLYVENGNKTVRCCEQSVNFSQSFTVRESPENPVIITSTKPEYINCRALSPRRLVIHGAFSLYIKVIAAQTVKLFTPHGELETLEETVSCADLKALCQEQFTVSEEISVTDKPPVEAILSSEVTASVTDCKAVTDKLMLGGEINLKLLYLSDIESGQTGKIDYVLPFSQIIDCEGTDENTVNCVCLEVMSFDVRLKNDVLSENPLIVFDVKLCATEQGYAVREESLVVDAYSTNYLSVPEFERLTVINEVYPTLEGFMEKFSASVDDGKISKILDLRADSVTSEFKAENGSAAVSGKINICLLALNGDGFPVFIERGFEYSHALTSAEANFLDCLRARASSLSYRLADDSTVEIRCELKISACAMKKSVNKVVSGVKVLEDKPIEADPFALTLYYASEGENLWDIAKAHNTRLDLLSAENSMDTLSVDSPRMLLIPKI